MVRRASCGLREPAGFRVARGNCARAAALSVSREEAQPASLLRARSVPQRSWSNYALEKDTTPARGLSPSVRGRGVMCQPWTLRIGRLTRGTRERATALAVSWEEAQHASLLRACAVPRWLRTCYAPRQGHCTSERLCSVGTWLWCDVPAAASENQPAFEWHATRVCAPLRSLSHGRRRSRQAYFARAAPRWLCPVHVL